ncbi:ROK family protein [Variovorax sp. JS1663]|uniref:ROK family protein n=1 Tax=Variovorax sp. JS1663 TaxID=1851577 RepID=UPI000B34248D|nr:ROK family protein [Variovorax sp. JS1663]OUL98415.1 glucokinase [Variovorax sp. JS1663]
MASDARKQPKKQTKNDADGPVPAHDIHGARELPTVLVEGYSLQLRDEGGFLGDQASQTAFRELLERWRRRHRRKGKKDPLGEQHSNELAKGTLDAALKSGRASEATDVVHAAIEEFAVGLAQVIRGFMRQPSWKGVERIVIGGGFPESDVGERAVLQAAAILQEMGERVPLARICHDTDDGGLLGWVHLAPPELLEHYDAILALDIGGTNVRCGIVKLRRKRARDLSKAKVLRREKWRHKDDSPNRRVLVTRLAEMLEDQVRYCKKKGIRLAPFVGIGCPGLIRKDGSIARGAQNMPGDWTSEHFHLPTALRRKLPTIRGVPTMVLMHNDAVVQGLSELPFMRDVKHWAVLTIGTGLGNVSYTNVG